jgi:hypothetical protein
MDISPEEVKGTSFFNIGKLSTVYPEGCLKRWKGGENPMPFPVNAIAYISSYGEDLKDICPHCDKNARCKLI